MITRHRLFDRLLVDRGSEFKREVICILNTYNIKRIQILVYYSLVNRMIKVGHKAFKEALMTLTNGGKGKWTRHLHAVLLADRTSVHGPTGYTPFYMVYGREAVLPIETKYLT